MLGADVVTCSDPDCPIRSAVIAPLLAEGKVVGTLTAYAPTASAGLARATGELARWVSAELDVAELGRTRTRAMEAELRALRAQISPHFIFNSLGAIASFVRTDPERARELLLEFADFTRYALRRGGTFTTLAEELRNVERYLVLEQARFGERLQISLLIAPEVLPVRVPYLAVQPLVENAVRHGLASKEGVGHVTITASDQGGGRDLDRRRRRRVGPGAGAARSSTGSPRRTRGPRQRRRAAAPGLRRRVRPRRRDGGGSRDPRELPGAEVRPGRPRGLTGGAVHCCAAAQHCTAPIHP